MHNIYKQKIKALLVLNCITMCISGMEQSLAQGIKELSGLSADAERQISLSLIGDFLLNQQEPITLGHSDTVYATAISSDSKHIATASFDSTAKIWNNHGNLEHILSGHVGLMNVIAISPDNQYIATGTFDKSNEELDRTIKIWDMHTGQLLHTLGHNEVDRHFTSISALAISPNNNYVVSGSADHAIKIWNLKTGQLILSFGGTTPNSPDWTANWINAIAITDDSTQIIVGDNAGSTITFNLKLGEFKQLQRHFPGAKFFQWH
jgi:WD40 repeat protein